MKRILILLAITAMFLFRDAYAQNDPYERHIDSLCRAGFYEEAYQYAKQRWQNLSPPDFVTKKSLNL